MGKLDLFFYPSSIAVVGASVDEANPSGIILSNLIGTFKGRIYAVNPHHKEIRGIGSYPSIKDVPGRVDLSIIITPPGAVPGIIKEHIEKGVNHVIIASGGFGETEAGKALEEEIKRLIQSSPLRIIGPNCLGIYNSEAGVDTFFLPRDRVPRPGIGGISIISQSGSILGTTMILMRENGLGIAKGISYGNRIDVDECELIEYLSRDKSTRIIGLCIESVRDGRKLLRVASRSKKPLIVLKLGKETAGQRATKYHTGSTAGRYEIYRAAFRRCGMIEAETLDEFIDLLKMFYVGKRWMGKRILIITNGGGMGVMTADLCNKWGLEVPPLSSQKREILGKTLPAYYSLSNPVDLTGSSTDDQYRLVLEVCADEFDGIIIIPFMTVPGLTPALGKYVVNSLKDYKGTVISIRSFSAEGMEVEKIFMANRIPVFHTPERAVKALSKFLTWRTRGRFTEKKLKRDRVISALIGRVKDDGRNMLLPEETEEILTRIGLYPAYARKMENRGIQLMVGAMGDSQFGPVVMVGPGDIWANLSGSMNMELAPLTMSSARDMILSSKIYPVLRGYGDMKRVKVKDIVRVLIKVSDLMVAFPEIGKLEFNPIRLSSEGLHIINARIWIK